MKKFSMLVNANDITGHIERGIYGHFSEHLGRCIYQGIYVGEDSPIPNIHGIRSDVVEAFRQIKMPVLRWPGGCFADEYHWRDGIGDKHTRTKVLNKSWGGVVEDNSFGTHEFMELCELVGCEPYIAGNVGSGTVRELAEWVEYMTSDDLSPTADLRRKNGREKAWKLKYLGIGNEAWGCGGNMTPEFYAGQYKQYRTFCRNFSGNRLYCIACGPSGADYNWTDVMMQNLKVNDWWQADGLSLHFYSVPEWNKKGLATEFSEDDYYELMNTVNYTDELLAVNIGIMDRYDPEGRVGLIVDEWGTWYDVEPGTNPAFLYQQNTMRDALVAAVSLNIFNRRSKRVKMANLAQAVNVLQALILTDGEKLIKTPTFHVFDLFKEHQDGECVYCHTQNENLREGKNVPMISSSASVRDGVLTVTIANCSLDESAEIECDICGSGAKSVSARTLTGEVHTCNDFDAPERLVTTELEAKLENGKLRVTLPACSVSCITLK